MQLVTEEEKAEYLGAVNQRNRSGSAAAWGAGLFCIGIVLTILFIFLFPYYLVISINMIVGGIILGKIQEKKTNLSAVNASDIGMRIGREIAERRTLSMIADFPPKANDLLGGVPDAQPPRFCPYCGRQAKASGRFCQYCGKPLV